MGLVHHQNWTLSMLIERATTALHAGRLNRSDFKYKTGLNFFCLKFLKGFKLIEDVDEGKMLTPIYTATFTPQSPPKRGSYRPPERVQNLNFETFENRKF